MNHDVQDHSGQDLESELLVFNRQVFLAQELRDGLDPLNLSRIELAVGRDRAAEVIDDHDLIAFLADVVGRNMATS